MGSRRTETAPSQARPRRPALSDPFHNTALQSAHIGAIRHYLYENHATSCTITYPAPCIGRDDPFVGFCFPKFNGLCSLGSAAGASLQATGCKLEEISCNAAKSDRPRHCNCSFLQTWNESTGDG